MQTTLKKTFDMVRAIRRSSDIKTSRGFNQFFSDRIIQAFSEVDLLAAIERLAKLVACQIGYIKGDTFATFTVAAASNDAGDVLAWFRKFPRVAAMIVSLKDDDDDYDVAIDSIVVEPEGDGDLFAAMLQPVYDIGIRVETLSPLAHGGDTKAGNATLFRRRQVIAGTNTLLELPFYAGNAVRGQMRDLLADHYLSSLGLPVNRGQPVVELWFFHLLYAGGVLEEMGKNTDKIMAALGKNGAVKAAGINTFRAMIPPLSVLGGAVGNRIVSGRICVGDLLPECLEWGNAGKSRAAQLLDWEFLTRRDDHEGRDAEDGNKSMIANTEVLKAGVNLNGGIDMDSHADEIDCSAVGQGLELLATRAHLGADSRRGFGKISAAFKNLPDAGIYRKYLADNKEKILSYLEAIGAIDARCTVDSKNNENCAGTEGLDTTSTGKLF